MEAEDIRSLAPLFLVPAFLFIAMEGEERVGTRSTDLQCVDHRQNNEFPSESEEITYVARKLKKTCYVLERPKAFKAKRRTSLQEGFEV